MQKFIVFLIMTTVFAVSCGSSKKTENDADVVTDEDEINDENAIETTSDDDIDAIDSCTSNPCKRIENSTGECIAKSKDKYYCGCIENYFWDGEKCTNPCVGVNCGKFEHSIGECRSLNAFMYKCGCVEGYWWWGKDKGCLKKKPTAVNVCSGQNKCYDNKKKIPCPGESAEFFGQDAHYAMLGYCIPQSFSIDYSVEDEPVVVDNNLTLMWQQKIPQLGKFYAEHALSYCENLVYGGYDDWRLPTEEEFMTIADYGRYHPAIDTEYFPDYASFWTATNYTIYTDSYDGPIHYSGWQEYYKIFDFTELSIFPVETYASHIINAGGGMGDYGSRQYQHSFYIRCVRGTKMLENSLIFTQKISGDTVWRKYDNGLIFMKKTDANHNWSEALKYCSELDYAGIPDWRLPNVKELLQSFDSEAHTSTTKLSDLTSDYQYKKDEKRENTFCVTDDPCEEGKIWDGTKCFKNPCFDNPCSHDDHSNGICNAINEEIYSCDCEATYYWSSGKMECSRSCDANPCKNKENSDGVCYDNESEGYSCGCVEGYVWLAYDCLENCCDPNPCENIANSDGICQIVNYVQLGGYPYCFCGCNEGYWWDNEDFWDGDFNSKGKCVNN